MSGKSSHNQWTVTKSKILSVEEVERLYAALKDAKDLSLQRLSHFVYIRDFYLLRVLLETGVRVFELTALLVGDFRGGGLIVKRGKGGKSRTVLLTKQTKRLLKDFIRVKETILNEPTDDEAPLFLSERRRPYTTRGVRKRVKHWFKACGFNGSLSVHSCRHTNISHLIAAGVDLPTVRNNAGHSNLAITSIYSHSTREDLGDISLFSSAKIGKRNFKGNGQQNDE